MVQSKRIEYIDALRGFTMILVVFCHIESHSFYNDPSIIGRILMTFRMPLFFFISGYIAYKAHKMWNINSYVSDCFKKIKVQLIPTIVFGLTYAYLIDQSNITTFLTDPLKLGYWFTITLLSMFLIYYTTSFLYAKIALPKGEDYIDNKKNIYAIILIGLVGVVLVSEKLFLKIFPSQALIYDTLSLSQLSSYFPFFIFGIIASMYKKSFEQITDNKYVITSILILFIAITTTRILLLQQPEHIVAQYDLYIKLAMGLNGILGITIVYKFFQKHQDSFTQEKTLGKYLQYIGRRTLDIYLLHYFLLPDLKFMGEFMGSSSTVVGLFTNIIISLMVIIVCLIISNTIRLSPILAHYLFGAKIK